MMTSFTLAGMDWKNIAPIIGMTPCESRVLPVIFRFFLVRAAPAQNHKR
jgi:hypothetical protein